MEGILYSRTAITLVFLIKFIKFMQFITNTLLLVKYEEMYHITVADFS